MPCARAAARISQPLTRQIDATCVNEDEEFVHVLSSVKRVVQGAGIAQDLKDALLVVRLHPLGSASKSGLIGRSPILASGGHVEGG